MSDTLKSKRPPSKTGRPRSRPPPRDARAEDSLPSLDGEAEPRRMTVRPTLELLPARIAVLEAELVRLKDERGAEADELARMLVRIAESERAKAATEQHAEFLAERVQELEANLEQARRETAEATELVTRRAELAELSAADGAASLERMRAELHADRSRLTDLETKLARTRRERTDEQATLRAARVELEQQTARALEDERSAAARARQQAAAAEVELAAIRERLAQAVVLVEKIERREEMAAALRSRSLEQARQLLAGETVSVASSEPPTPAVASRPPRPPPASATRPHESHDSPESTMEVSVEEIEIDLAD
jgi:chromosome segregation ATPase